MSFNNNKSFSHTEQTSTLFPTRHPRLIRIWRSAGPGRPITSFWIPAVPTPPKGSPVQ
jgi:hypothetical protein